MVTRVLGKWRSNPYNKRSELGKSCGTGKNITRKVSSNPKFACCGGAKSLKVLKRMVHSDAQETPFRIQERGRRF